MNDWQRFIRDEATAEALKSEAAQFLADIAGQPLPLILDDQRHYLPGRERSYNARFYRSAQGVPCLCLRVVNYKTSNTVVFDDYTAIRNLWQFFQAHGVLQKREPVSVVEVFADVASTSEDPRKIERMWRRSYVDWSHARPTGFSPYLERKGVSRQAQLENPVRFEVDGTVVALIQAIDGRSRGLQRITPEGEKRLSMGARKAGAAIWLAPRLPFTFMPSSLMICEGLATGLTLRSVFRMPVLCALDAGNIVPTARLLRENYPNAHIWIACDNDCHKPDKPNVGVEAGRAAAEEFGCSLLIPPVDGPSQTDWNDLHRDLPFEEFRRLMTGTSAVSRDRVPVPVSADLLSALQ